MGQLDIVSDWQIIKLSKAGVSLYVAHGTGDGTIFIPFENIVAIHTIDEDFLEKYATPEVRAAQLVRSRSLESTETQPA